MMMVTLIAAADAKGGALAKDNKWEERPCLSTVLVVKLQRSVWVQPNPVSSRSREREG